MACSFELTLTNFIVFGALILVLKKVVKIFQQWKVEKLLEKYDNTPRDKVILHTLWRCKPLPSLSPYGLKLETFLRMAKIPYELETEDYQGPKGKLPWISFNGTHVADSQLCIDFLRKKFNVDINDKHSAEELGKARACRVLLEDRFVLGLIQYRWIENPSKITQYCKFPAMFKPMLLFIPRNIQKMMIMNGIAMHTPTEIYQMTEDDLRAVSSILGNKKFICGEEPCEDDCAIFGMLSQAVWGSPGSPFEKLVNDEQTNLKQYCLRMKSAYWPDWDSCLDRS